MHATPFDTNNLLENLNTVLVVIDNSLRIVYANHAGQALFATGTKQLYGQPLADFFVPNTINKARLRAAFRRGEDFTENEIKLYFRDNRVVLADLTVTNLSTEDGPTLLFEVKKIDQQKRISRENQQHAQHYAARELIRGLAHEIKNPLGGIRGAAQLLEKALESAEQKEFTQLIIEQSDRLRNLVDRLLGPNSLPRLEWCNLHRPLEKVRSLMKADTTQAIAITRDYDPSIPEVRIDPDMLAPVVESGHRLASTLRRLGAPLAHITERSEDLRSLGRRASELANHLDFVLEAADPDFVYFLERRGQGLFLRASPVDVSTIIRELLLDRMRATILTSATLAVDGSFDYQRVRLGIRDAIEIRLEPEFDYAKQTVLYLPEEMPEPRASNFTQAAATEIAGLLEATRGRAFVLFTSHANLREVHRLITDSVAFPLLVQGTAPRSVLLRKFKATPNAVLLATSSFWQGVDVSGDTLSCVIIDKLPFATPDDPITAARIQAITEGGGNPFAEYQVPLAILSLLQGIGRLIRHRKDRGVLSILDPRILTKGYGRRFLASLPPAPIVRGMKDVRKFLDLQGM